MSPSVTTTTSISMISAKQIASTERIVRMHHSTVMNVHIASLLCAFAGVAVYLNTLHNDLVFDDIPAVKYNKDLRPDTPWSNLLVHDYWGNSLQNPTSHKSYRPLCVATFRLNYLLAELEPMGYHLVNILLHGVVCYLYVHLVSLVCSQVWPALIAGLLFAVHPIHTEAVAGVVGRAELLCAVFYILCILSYRRSFRSQGVSAVWLVVSLVCSVLALLSKEQGVTALPVCLAMDFLVLHKLDLVRFLRPPSADPDIHAPKKGNMRSFFVRGIAVGVVGLVTIVTRILVSNGQPTAMFKDRNINPPLSLSWPWRQLSWSHLVAVNSWLALCPSPLTADWRFGAVPLTLSLAHPHNLHTLLTLLTLTGLATFALYRQYGVVLFGLSLLVFPYVPASNLFFPVGFVVAERVLYLPSMGLCLLAGHGLWKLLQHTQKKQALNITIKGALAFLLLTHTVKTVHRNSDWKDSLSLYKAGVKLNHNNALLMNNIGLQYVIAGDYEAAIKFYEAGMTVSPNYTGNYYNYGKLMNMAQQFHKAEEPLRMAISVAETTGSEFNRLPESYHQLIQTLLSHPSRLHEAHTLVDHALTHHPHHTHLHTDKCHILNQLNRTQDAIHWCKEALRLNPSSLRSHYILGGLYSRLGRSEEAENVYRELLVLEPESVGGRSQLAAVLQQRGAVKEMNEAATLWEAVLTFDPHNIDALLNLALVQESLSQIQASVDTINKVLQLQPFHRQALYQVAELLYRHGNLEEASRVLTRLYSIDRLYKDVRVWLARVNNELRSRPTR